MTGTTLEIRGPPTQPPKPPLSEAQGEVRGVVRYTPARVPDPMTGAGPSGENVFMPLEEMGIRK